MRRISVLFAAASLLPFCATPALASPPPIPPSAPAFGSSTTAVAANGEQRDVGWSSPYSYPYLVKGGHGLTQAQQTHNATALTTWYNDNCNNYPHGDGVIQGNYIQLFGEVVWIPTAAGSAGPNVCKVLASGVTFEQYDNLLNGQAASTPVFALGGHYSYYEIGWACQGDQTKNSGAGGCADGPGTANNPTEIGSTTADVAAGAGVGSNGIELRYWVDGYIDARIRDCARCIYVTQMDATAYGDQSGHNSEFNNRGKIRVQNYSYRAVDLESYSGCTTTPGSCNITGGATGSQFAQIYISNGGNSTSTDGNANIPFLDSGISDQFGQVNVEGTKFCAVASDSTWDSHTPCQHAVGLAQSATVQHLHEENLEPGVNNAILLNANSASNVHVLAMDVASMTPNGNTVYLSGEFGSDIGITIDSLSTAGCYTLNNSSGDLNCATGSLTFTSGTPPTNNQTVTVGDQTYTFVTSLGSSPNQVLIGASAATAETNLIAAIDLNAGAGTTYTASTLPNAGAFAYVNNYTLSLVSKVPGTAGNSVPISSAATGVTASGSTLSGGTNFLLLHATTAVTRGKLTVGAITRSGVHDLSLDGSAALSTGQPLIKALDTFSLSSFAWQPGRVYGESADTGALAPTADTLYARLIYVPSWYLIDNLQVGVMAGVTSSQCRLGLYTYTGTTQPGALVRDFGTTSTASAGAAATGATVMPTEQEPGYVWVAAVCDPNGGASVPAIVGAGEQGRTVFGQPSANGFTAKANYTSGVYAAQTISSWSSYVLPATFPTITENAGALTPMVVVHVATNGAP